MNRVDMPAPFEFTTDDGAIPIPNAELVGVKATIQKKKGERELHVTRGDREYRHFIDCGTPLVRQ